ncbi:cytochrome P450 [Streptosporangium carneum]|uniref:Cytochrome P450 n=1 Tax=Streptosporangium carneum TaxID=47481 RepID=A0A9W6IB58_9ACTN|nr:cytochrome P450 [Streptosporangium carneum]GLK14468.1 cytochrome P450 [Streptosporangium carneum]
MDTEVSGLHDALPGGGAEPDFPMARGCPYHPPPGYARLRAHGPLARVTLAGGRPAWLVTGHAEVRALLADSRISADVTDPRYPELEHIPPDLRVAPEALRESQSFVQMDPPEHGVHRRMLSREFGPGRVSALRPVIQRAVDRLLDRLLSERPPVDLVPAFAAALPALVLTEILGVRGARRAVFYECLRRGDRGLGELRPHLERLLLAEDDGEVGSGLLGDLVARMRAGELTYRRTLSTVMMLLVAGHETTENMIALGVLTLLEHPRQLRRMRDDPSLLPDAVEELLRYLSIADVLLRVAKADVELAGSTIRAGDAVVLSTAAANRDGEAFPDPDVLDLSRRARGQVAFGHGPHLCLGQHLARLELEVALGTLFERVPTLRLATPVERLPAKPPLSLQGVTELPVTWETGTRAGTGAGTGAGTRTGSEAKEVRACPVSQA